VTEKTGQESFFYGYIITAAGFAIWAIGWGTYTPSFSVFFKPLLAEFGWSRADTSMAYSLSFLVQAGLAIVMGWLTDRLGPRIVISVLGSALGICYLLMSQVSSLWQFTVTYAVVGGIGVSTLNVPVMVTISRWFTKRRGLMIGIVQAGIGLGGFVFSPLTGWLIVSYGWRSAYVVLGFIALVGMFVGGLFLRRDPREKGQLPDGERLAAVTEAKPSNPGFQAVGFTLREALRTKQFWVIAGIYGVFGFCRSTYTAHLAAHVQDLGFSLADGANVLAVVIGASVFGRIGLGRVADIIGSRRGFIISFGVTALSLIWVLISKELWMFYLFAFVFGVAWGNQAVLRFAIASEYFGLASLGLIMGALGVGESVAAMLGSYIAGYIFDIFGNYHVMFWIGIAISVTGMILAVVLKPEISQPPNPFPRQRA
jgi:OFA family oxalate/formate antiporter-like MFS transporter